MAAPSINTDAIQSPSGAMALLGTEPMTSLFTGSVARVAEYGDGRLVFVDLAGVTGDDARADRTRESPAAILDPLLPLRIEGEIQYPISTAGEDLIVTLINNKGVYKEPRDPAEFDKSEKKTVRLHLPEVAGYEWRGADLRQQGASVGINRNRVSVQIPPGGIEILRFAKEPSPN